MTKKQMNNAEVARLTQLLAAHYTKPAGAGFWVWEKGWDDARAARESRIPGINDGHVRRLRVSAFGKSEPPPPSESRGAMLQRVRRLEARVSFLEAQLGIAAPSNGHMSNEPTHANTR